MREGIPWVDLGALAEQALAALVADLPPPQLAVPKSLHIPWDQGDVQVCPCPGCVTGLGTGGLPLAPKSHVPSGEPVPEHGAAPHLLLLPDLGRAEILHP